MNNFRHLLSPYTVAGVTFRNRIFAAPNILVPDEFEKPEIYDDAVVDGYLGYVEEKAKGGFSCVTIGNVPFKFEALLEMPEGEVLQSREFSILREIADRIKKHGSVPSLELISGGQYLRSGMIATYGFFMGPCADKTPDGEEIVEMDAKLRDRVSGDYARIAEILKLAGFKMIMIQAGHFWLVNQWLSPLWNKRTDEYGGDMAGRSRFPIEMLDAIRAKVGRDMLIEYRVSGSDLYDGGNTVEDIIELIGLIKSRVDIIHVSSGSLQIPGKMQKGLTLYAEYGNNVYLSEAIKRACPDVPVSVVGNLINPEHMENCIAEGKTDFVSIARGAIADPTLPLKLQEGRRDEVVPCQRCFNCMNDRRSETGRYENQECAMNPYTLKDLDRSKTRNPKNILIVGAGAAGITAAFTAAEKGHEVTLVEKSSELTGILKFTKGDTVKRDLKLYVNYLYAMLEKHKIKVICNTEVTPEYVKSSGADAVFIATGSEPLVPPIPGIELASHVLDIYRTPELLKGKSTIVIGGGLAGCEAAVHIANLGQSVTVVEMRDEIGADVFPQAAGGLKAAFEENGIAEVPGVVCEKITDSGVEIRDKGGHTSFLAADNVVYGLGMRAVNSLEDQISGMCEKVVTIGDCRRPGKIMNAVYDAVYAVLSLD